jgi:hypothetical protein
MENAGAVVLVVGVIGLIGGLIYLSIWLEKKRTEFMQGYAQNKGFTFLGANHELWQQLETFKLFSQGHSRELKNAMRGVKEVGEVHVADYTYVTGSGKHRQVHHQTIVVVRTPGRAAPHFFARRQNSFFDALGKMFGGQDINFEDDPAFSKAFVLQTAGDEQLLRNFMSPRLREALTGLSNKKPQLEASGELLLVHFSRRLKKHDDIDALLSDTTNVRRNWS